MNPIHTNPVLKRNEYDLLELLQSHPQLQIPLDQYNINVTANYGQRLSAEETWEEIKKAPGAGKPAHLYLHFPFCSYICKFCNYVKKFLPDNDKKSQMLDKWAGLLIEESERYLAGVEWLSNARIESFYMGGGTSSLLETRQLARILKHVRAGYSLTDDCEMSLEGNPDNFLYEEIPRAVELGFNRFSIGVQSFQNEVNEFAGRKHNREMSIRAIENLLASGKPFNVDMMFGLPFQTPETVHEDIRILTEMKTPTITIYRLRNADRHKMGIGNAGVWNNQRIKEALHKEKKFPSLEENYRFRDQAVGVLLDSGYLPSPCGWWSAPGTYPDGNIPQVSKNKWERHNTMIGIGPGAYGWISATPGKIIQTHNNTDIHGYDKHLANETSVPLAYGRKLEGAEAVGTALGFAYKACQPISLERFRNQFMVDLLNDFPYGDVLAEMMRNEFLILSEDQTHLIPTLKGEALHEEIISVYLHEKIGNFTGQVCKKI